MTNNHANLDQIFGALSDPTRRAIVVRLCERPASVGELAKPFEMALPTLLKHIRVLETGGLVTTEKVGRVRTCSLRAEVLQATEQWLAAQRAIWESRFDRLETYVATVQAQEKSRDRRKKR